MIPKKPALGLDPRVGPGFRKRSCAKKCSYKRGARLRRLGGLFVFRSPAAVQPKPLLGMFADPAFDHAGNDLHGAGDVDFSVGSARRRDLLGDLAAEAVPRQPDNASAVDRAVEMASQPRDQRVGHGAAAEESHLDAAHIIPVSYTHL